MPNAAEKIAHIEAALRRRFFLLVPERAQNWTPAQHDVDRCSRSLAAYALCGMCGLTDAAAAGALVDGGNDGGIDALYFDRAKQRLLVVQSKFKRPNNPGNPQGTGPDQGETLKFINGTKALMERRFDGFNAAVRNRLDEIEEALDTPGVKICLALPFLGEALDLHAKADLDAFVAQTNNLSDCMSATVVGITQTYDWMVAEQANHAVDVRLTLEKWSSVTAPRKAVYGLVKGQDLAALVTEHGTALFERNIRHYLGSVGVNVAIEETVRRRPEDFFYLNNGITAVTTAITPAPGSPDRCVFGLTAFSIVNGAQTAGSITTASLAAAISENAKLHITIIEVPDPADDFSVRVTRARNYQNQVRGVDFAALDPNQERIRQELAAVGIRYHYRPSAESRVGADGKGVPRVIRYLSEVEGLVPSTWWPHEEVGHNDEAKKDAYNLHGKENAFDTPKPERLLGRIVHIATNPGDLVLDSFAGSGTTGAVAHKMGRRWIMVELGEHAHTHIIPRLKKVIDGDDKGGVTEATGWQGGGGFRYFKLAPSLLEVDKWGRDVISKAYNAEMLAEALCKIEGFTYAPSDAVYWQQGTSTERDFIYVTTQTLSPEQLDALSEEVGPDRTLLVLCAAFRGNASAWPNLTVKKIPNHIRERCEWGHDDYSLNVENLPKAQPAPKAADKASPRSASQPGLFDLAGDDQ